SVGCVDGEVGVLALRTSIIADPLEAFMAHRAWAPERRRTQNTAETPQIALLARWSLAQGRGLQMCCHRPHRLLPLPIGHSVDDEQSASFGRALRSSVFKGPFGATIAARIDILYDRPYCAHIDSLYEGPAMASPQTNLLQGTLDLLILKALTLGDMH